MDSVDWGKWDQGREFLEIKSVDNIPVEVTEPLDMDIGQEFNFRINASESSTSFYIADFLEACDKLKLLVPDGLVGRRLRWVKVRREAKKVEFSTENYVPSAVLGEHDTKPYFDSVYGKAEPVATEAPDLLGEMLALAVGKTEKQFRTAVTLNPKLVGSPLLALAKMGAITQSFITGGQLTLDGEVYRKV